MGNANLQQFAETYALSHGYHTQKKLKFPVAARLGFA